MTFTPLNILSNTIASGAFIGLGIVRVTQSGEPLNLALAAHAILVGLALYMREPAKKEAHIVEQLLVWGLAIAPMAFVQTRESPAPWLQAIATLGVLLTIWSVVSLWGAFAIAPADRGLRTGGPYRFIRHPMYAGQMLSLVAILASGVGLLSWLVALASMAGAFWRILREERMIGGYQDYAARVRWRLIPWVF
jgi:protein-S-isoprenylcysteine O-methyltransferase Ste14